MRVHVCGCKGQRCQLVMQQRSSQLDQSESLSHSPRPFCYITNMPFTKQPASCQTDLNHTRIHIFTQPLTKPPTAQTVEKQKDKDAKKKSNSARREQFTRHVSSFFNVKTYRFQKKYPQDQDPQPDQKERDEIRDRATAAQLGLTDRLWSGDMKRKRIKRG